MQQFEISTFAIMFSTIQEVLTLSHIQQINSRPFIWKTVVERRPLTYQRSQGSKPVMSIGFAFGIFPHKQRLRTGYVSRMQTSSALLI